MNYRAWSPLRRVLKTLRAVLRGAHPSRCVLDGMRVVRTLLLSTDVSRWRQVAQELPPWDGRNELIAALVPVNSSVLDLGAGPQSLRRYLDPGCIYRACDVVPSSNDVLLCDFNHGIYPHVDQPYDYVVCSGVLEYVRDPVAFLTAVVPLGRNLILTYAPVQYGDTLWTRMTQGWVNHLSQRQLENLLNGLGLSWVIAERWNGQLIYSACRPCGSASSSSVCLRQGVVTQ